jgi:cation:H+ antiporter
LLSAFQILFGFLLLLTGGELLVRGASRLARAAGIPPLIVGLTVVAFCTSAPELAVSSFSAFQGQADLAVGNVVGSCICNILCVLGFAAILTPLMIDAKLIRWETPLLIAISALFFLFVRDGELERWQGALMFLTLIAYITWTIIQAKREKASVQRELESVLREATDLSEEEESELREPRSLGIALALLLVGLGMLMLGSNQLVIGAVRIAELLGVSELMIGLTILAIGTSLPEIAISAIAASKGKIDLAVGNIVGSNIFNILGVLGLTAIFAPKGVPVTSQAINFDIPLMIFLPLLCLPIFFTGMRITRREGILFMGGYVAYLACLVVTAKSPELGGRCRFILFGIGGPIVLIASYTFAFLDWKQRRATSSTGVAPPTSS